MATSYCDICHGSGWVASDLEIGHPDFGRLHRCECQAELDKERWLKECGLTAAQMEAVKGLKNTGPGTKAMMDAVKAFITNPVGMLFIHGSNGVGKTTAAYGMTRRLIDAGYRTVYVTGPNMFAWIRDGYSATTQDETAMRRLDRLQSVRVLIIDELDKVRPTDWVREIMSMFVDNRYRRREELGTVVIANNPDNLSPDVVSRLMEGAVVLNQDSDYRRRQG